RLRDAGPAARETILQAFADEYSTGAVRTLADVQPALADVEARRGTVEALARNYIDRKPYAGTWWGTQPAGQKPPARSVAWDRQPIVREAVLKALTDKDAGVRKAAVVALVAANEAVTFEPLVKQFASEKDPDTKADIIRAVAGLGKGDTTFLIG